MVRILKKSVMYLMLLLPWGIFTLPERGSPPPLCAVVTQIDITCTYDGYTLSRCYRSEDKLSAVLTYLRLLKPRKNTGTDPEQIAGERYRMVLTFSDGSKKSYIQHSYRYLSADHRPWQVINKGTASRLHALLEALPGDGAAES